MSFLRLLNCTHLCSQHQTVLPGWCNLISFIKLPAGTGRGHVLKSAALLKFFNCPGIYLATNWQPCLELSCAYHAVLWGTLSAHPGIKLQLREMWFALQWAGCTYGHCLQMTLSGILNNASLPNITWNRKQKCVISRTQKQTLFPTDFSILLPYLA